MKPYTVFLSAGEASGDHLAAGLVAALSRLRPDWRLIGIGSHTMQAAGMELVLDLTHTSAIGISESLAVFPAALRALAQAKGHLRRIRPDIFLAVDCQGINLILAKTARSVGARVIYYIPPQNFLWHDTKRGREIVRRSDLMINIFEEGHRFYQSLGARSVFAGHPLAATSNNCNKPKMQDAPPLVVLAAGIRRGERRRFVPLLAKAAHLIAAVHPQISFASPSSNPRHASQLIRDFARAGISVTTGPSQDLFRLADAAIIKSGTMALEAAIAGCPYCVFYRISRLSWFIMARLWGVKRKLRFISLPNILANQELAREFLQGAAKPPALADEILALLDNASYRERHRAGLAQCTASLRREDPWQDAAISVIEFVESEVARAALASPLEPENVHQEKTTQAGALPLVVCALLVPQDGLVYAFRRQSGTEADGKWEFPGGRVEAGEQAEEAILRELAEELSIRAKVVQRLPTVNDGKITLVPFVCKIITGEGFRLRAHSAVRLESGEKLRGLDWLPLDREILEAWLARHP